MTTDMREFFGSEFNRNPPASPIDLDGLGERFGAKLPDDYLAYLRVSNGGEGPVGPDSYLILFPAEQIAVLNEAYEVDRWAEGLVIFGSDGGGEAIAFDTRSLPPRIVSVPFVGMSLDLVRPIAFDLKGFSESLLGL